MEKTKRTNNPKVGPIFGRIWGAAAELREAGPCNSSTGPNYTQHSVEVVDLKGVVNSA